MWWYNKKLKYKITFVRVVHQRHEAIVEAESEAAVEQMYKDGAIETTITDELIIDENDQEITRHLRLSL
jgi:hypothetical protein